MDDCGKLVANWVISCAKCGDDESIDGEDRVEATKDARTKGWVNFPKGFNNNPAHMGWICPDCNPEAPVRHKLKTGDAVAALQRRAYE